MVTILEECAPDKSMDRIITPAKQLSLHILVEHVQQLVIDGIEEAKYLSLAIDIPQLEIFAMKVSDKNAQE